MDYNDFTLRLRDLEDGQFQVEVLHSPVGEMNQPTVVAYEPARLTRWLNKLEFKGIQQPELIALGEALADLLLPNEPRQMLLRSLAALPDGSGLRLRLVINEPELANLPWEYVYLYPTSAGEAIEKNLDGFLVLDPRLSIVRHEALDAKPGAVGATQPLRLVVGLATPTDQAPLDLEKERRTIDDALAEVNEIQHKVVDHMTVPAFEQAVQGAHIFHFAGHGTFSQQASGAEGTRDLKLISTQDEDGRRTLEGAGLLAFENGEGKTHLFPADKVAQNLVSVRLAVLGACESGRRDNVNVWSGIAPALMRNGVPAVVAMQYEVYDKSAIAFSRRFYQAISVGLSLDEAVTQGRLAVLNLDAPFDLDFGVSVLYMRAPDGMIFASVTEDSALAEQRQQAQVTVKQLVDELHRGGKLTGIEVAVMTGGEVVVRQRMKQVSGELIGVKADKLDGGSVNIDQEIDEVEGSLTGAKIGSLGSSSGGPNVDQNIDDIGSGGIATGIVQAGNGQ